MNKERDSQLAFENLQIGNQSNLFKCVGRCAVKVTITYTGKNQVFRFV